MYMTSLEFDLSNGSLSEGVYQTLRNAIIKGDIKPGERLTEQGVAAEASISRTPVREALNRLQDEGLLKNSGRSKIVALPTLEEINDLYSVRECLEGLSARLAANFRSETELMTMEGLLGRLRTVVHDDDIPSVVQVNRAIHETIWQASRNRYLTQQLRTLRSFVDRLQASTLRVRERNLKALEEHEKIHEAILNKDADLAEKLVRQHFRQAEATRMMLLRMEWSD